MAFSDDFPKCLRWPRVEHFLYASYGLNRARAGAEVICRRLEAGCWFVYAGPWTRSALVSSLVPRQSAAPPPPPPPLMPPNVQGNENITKPCFLTFRLLALVGPDSFGCRLPPHPGPLPKPTRGVWGGVLPSSDWVDVFAQAVPT